jgi:V8-like Glu-specific endopeptidase
MRARSRPRLAAAAAFTLAVALAAALAAVGATAGAATGGARPAGVVHAVSAAAQRAATAFWTPSRMASATRAATANASAAPAGPPPGIPRPQLFSGVPTVGTLFFTTGTQAHFCSASVVNSFTGNVVLTAAHCVYGSTYATNIEFVPKYHSGKLPYGAWPVATITVAAGWQRSHDQNLDFAFLTVSPPAGTRTPIQLVTGGLWLGIDQGYDHPIEVIGYNDAGNAPIKCASTSFKYEANQMKFFCLNYQSGTSGGPWILGFDPSTGTGTVFGVIGGYKEGGLHPWASFSAYFARPTLALFLQAEAQS